MPEIKIEGVVKRFGDVVALNDVSLDIEDGSFTTLLGPSGCGKTTLLRILSGLEQADGGRIFMNGRPVFSASEGIELSPRERNLGLVFQSYALWPHMTVFDNVAYGLRERKVPRDEIRARVADTLERLKMGGLEQRYPSELSGGQQQRVAIARMLVVEPELLLMDEPLSNLDARLRIDMRAELQRIHRDLGLTIVYVTHDQVEAMTLSTMVAVMKDGVVQQYAPPEDVYLRPANTFVAEFIGNPRINFLPGVVQNGVVETSSGFRFASRAKEAAAGAKVSIAVRPEDIAISKSGDGPSFSVYASLMSGADTFLSLRRDDVTLLARSEGRHNYELDEEVIVTIDDGSVNVFDERGQALW